MPVFIGSHDKERPAIFSVKLSLDLSHNCCTIASSSSIRWLCTLNLFQLHVFDFGIVGLNSTQCRFYVLVLPLLTAYPALRPEPLSFVGRTSEKNERAGQFSEINSNANNSF